MRRLQDAGREPVLPEVSLAPHLLTYLMEIGPTLPGGMGPAAITHGEIRAWQENTGVSLSSWEARTVRQLSRDYVSELCAASDRDRRAPYLPDAVDTVKVALDLRAAISAIAKT